MATAVVFGSMTCAAAVAAPGAESAQSLPHRLHPDDWPYPDYFTTALGFTPFRPGQRTSALKLLSNVEPDLLVLPVQMQAFGWSSGFAALIGAQLDHELAARGQRANRQTDLYDADGPFVRRFDDAQVKAFATAHPRAAVLALYVGRDAAGRALVTLTLKRGAKTLRAHRSATESAAPAATLASIGALWPGLLTEIGIAAPAPAAVAPARPPRRCVAGDWDLEDLAADGERSARACRALIAGTLMPEFMWPTLDYARPKTPNKLAWLAEAHVEADALVPASAEAVRTLAWGQLEITEAPAAATRLTGLIDLDDPVARPLARLLWSWHRTKDMPTRSRADTGRAYAAQASQGLPPFARVAFGERAELPQDFRRVNLCALEVLLPALRVPGECAQDAAAAPRRSRPASAMERALLEGWRLARSIRDIEIEGDERGDPKARSAVLDALPERIASHPFVRQMRFATEHFEKATGAYESLLQRATAAATDFVQTTADLQRWSSMLANHMVTAGAWTPDQRLRDDPRIATLARDEWRLISALEYDGYMQRGEPPPRFTDQSDAAFLRPEPARPGTNPMLPKSVPIAASTGAAPGASSPAVRSPESALFPPSSRPAPDVATPELERLVAKEPADMVSRMALTLLRLKTGQTVAQAQAFVDALPPNNTSKGIGASHSWSYPAHDFLFMGEFEASRKYYERVASTRTFSESDLHARVRLRLLDGDVPGALAASRERLQRYESDYARRDVAGFEFITGHGERGWAALQPRLQLSELPELWIAVMVGHRTQGLTARQSSEWVTRSGVSTSIVRSLPISAYFLQRVVNDDRVPSPDDIALVAELARKGTPLGALFEASSRLKRLAMSDTTDPKALEGLAPLISETRSDHRQTLMPLYAWVAWRASGGKDPALATFREATLNAEFDFLVAKALVLGLENQPAQAMTFLRAARLELAGLSAGRLQEDLRSAPYIAALASYLLYTKTRDAVYRDEALRVARTYQRIFPFVGWPHALDALLSPDGPGRADAACRAQFLDRNSLFLSRAGQLPKVDSAACRKALW